MSGAHMQLSLFDSSNIDQLEWPQTDAGLYAKKYIEPLIKNGLGTYVSNLQSEIFALKFDQYVFPVIVANEEEKNSYICSPYDHYISYGKDSYDSLTSNRFSSFFVSNALDVLGLFGQFGKIRTVVYVNHWLFSTDLYPAALTTQHVRSIVSFLKLRFPNHAIIFRSANPITTPNAQVSLKDAGFHMIPSRYVNVTKSANDALFATRIIKSDLKLWRETSYKVYDDSEISRDECFEFLKLYNTLYLDQHSQRNPKYTLSFIEHLFDQKLLHFKVLKLDGIYKGIAGYYVKDGVMMCPFFGYDKTNAQHTTIYRLLNTALLLEARNKGLVFHQSSGATFYKTIRRAEGCIESMAVYSKHLPFKQKFTWSTLNFFINLFAPRYMKRY